MHIPEIFITVIKEQAMLSENEIYGWLIGYQNENIPHVLAIIECKRFDQQTIISAIPQAQEFQEISSLMPQGVGPIGIYHSHPFSGEVFHSYTDFTTLISLSNQFPRCISIITNGKEIKFYQMGSQSEVKEIKVKYLNPKIPKIIICVLEQSFHIILNKSTTNRLDDSRLKVKISNEISNFLAKSWNDLELFFKNKHKISENDKIANYLVTELNQTPIQIKLQTKMKINNNIQVIIKNGNDAIDDKEIIHDDNYILNLDLNIKVPIYITNENIKFSELKQVLKVELVSNNIIQKIFNSVIDFENQRIIIPDDYYLEFFGFYIRFLYFKEKNLNENELALKTYESVRKILSQFESYINIDLSKDISSQIYTIFKNIKKFSKNFSWSENINKNLKLLKRFYDEKSL